MRTSLAALVLGLVPALAGAQSVRHDGFVGQAQLGLGWCTDDQCDEDNYIDAEYGTGVSFGAFLGYRFPWPHVSVGANLQYSLHPPDDEESWADDASGYSFAFDFDVRAHPIVRGPIDPWVGLGFGYAFAGSSWDNAIANRGESVSLSGPAVGLSLGTDWWLSDSFAIGLAFRYLFVFWNELCLETGIAEAAWPDDVCESPETWEEDRPFSGIEENDLPNLGQILLTGTFSP